ncbi:MAG TPA: YqhR family membrane protein [Pseudogracilibacillus sp.]|nr:YqhR family membrane protein [Pseudogracilibacillus sp.]
MEKSKKRHYAIINAVIVGFFGGILLAKLQLVFYYFNISKVNYEKILALFYIDGQWIEKWYGALLFIFIMGGLSILVAFVYYIICRRVKGWLMGALFGLALWVIFGSLIPTLLYEIKWTSFYKSNTNVLQVCAFLLYGIFIGYSISYNEELRLYEEENS